MAGNTQQRALLLFDGTCGPCTRSARWVQRHAGDRLEVLPSQAPGALERAGVTRAEANRSLWVAGVPGGPVEGAPAVNHLLRRMGGIWGVAGVLLQMPGLLHLEDLAYRAFARNRSRFAFLGITPACDEPGSCL